MTKLTLRQVLAYLDDSLDPDQTKQVGKLIAESEAAQQLVDRIRTITRRRRVTAPAAGLLGDDHTADPNFVAAYLDNQVPMEKALEFERLCIENELYLAEAAACHQILTVGSGEPVIVPPSAHQRMYGLVPGPESQPVRGAGSRVVEPRAAHRSREELGPTWHDEEEPRRNWFVPLAAMALLGALATLFYLITLQTPKPGAVPLAAQGPAQAPIAPPAEAEPAPAPAPAPEAEPRTAEIPSGSPQVAFSIGTWSGLLAARPAMPADLLAMLNVREIMPERVDQPPPPPPEVKPAVEPPPPPVAKPAINPAVQQVGQLSGETTRDFWLMRRTQAGAWNLAAPRALVNSNELLVAPAGYRAGVLINQNRLTLWGTAPQAGASSVYESAITLHVGERVDVDFTLERGRVVFTAKPQGITTVRLRFRGEVWDMQLKPGSELGLEATSRLPVGNGPWTPHAKLALHVNQGQVVVTRDGKGENVEVGKSLLWDNAYSGTGPGMVVTQPEPPAWLAKKPNPAPDLRDALQAFNRRVTDKVAAAKKEEPLGWIRVACEEAIADRRPWERALALALLGTLDQTGALAATLEEANQPELRRLAMSLLENFLGRDLDQHVVLAAELRKRGYEAADADRLVVLLRGIDQPNRVQIRALLRDLKSNRLALREAAFANLQTLFPAERLAGYDPAASAMQRDRAVDALEARLIR